MKPTKEQINELAKKLFFAAWSRPTRRRLRVSDEELEKAWSLVGYDVYHNMARFVLVEVLPEYTVKRGVK